jgi:SAM-dependent methyltransferase
MSDYLPSTYGDRIADSYDSLYSEYDASAVELLAELAGAGPVLELGIGTGRLALPLAARGIEVRGIDASEAMVAKLRAKPGSGNLQVTVADFAAFKLDQRYSLIYVAFNTFFALQSQNEQVQCFKAVADHLRDGGCFLIEAFVPDLSRFDRGQRVSVFDLRLDGLIIEASQHNPALQQVVSQTVQLSEAGTRLFPVRLRYAWPSELDLMARLAGLELRERWTNWKREEFGSHSQSHVSVYGQVR